MVVRDGCNRGKKNLLHIRVTTAMDKVATSIGSCYNASGRYSDGVSQHQAQQRPRRGVTSTMGMSAGWGDFAVWAGPISIRAMEANGQRAEPSTQLVETVQTGLGPALLQWPFQFPNGFPNWFKRFKLENAEMRSSYCPKFSKLGMLIDNFK
jgi:hypothetical protein